MDWSTLTRLAPELAIVIIFVWFTLERDKRQDASEEKREALRIASEDKRDAEWRTFLKDSKEANNAALGRLADEIKANNANVAAMTGVIIAHDNRSTQSVHTVTQTIPAPPQK